MGPEPIEIPSLPQGPVPHPPKPIGAILASVALARARYRYLHDARFHARVHGLVQILTNTPQTADLFTKRDRALHPIDLIATILQADEMVVAEIEGMSRARD